MTPPGLNSEGGLNHTKIVARVTNKLLVYRERAYRAVHAQMAYSSPRNVRFGCAP